MEASFAMYPDFGNHIGGSSRFKGGRGYPIKVSAKQKLNADSLTTVELAAVGQLLPLVVQVPLFLVKQRHPAETNRIHQDNNGAASLEKNRKGSSGKQTRAINVQCFMVTQ